MRNQTLGFTRRQTQRNVAKGVKVMSLFKRGRTWWTDFSVNGVRYRVSLDTTDWREAQSQEKEEIARASEGKLSSSRQQFARLAFPEAADRYLADKLARLAPSSAEKERYRSKPLRAFFGATKLAKITVDSSGNTSFSESKPGPAIRSSTWRS